MDGFEIKQFSLEDRQSFGSRVGIGFSVLDFVRDKA